MNEITERINRTLTQIRQDIHDLGHLRTLEKGITERILSNAESLCSMRKEEQEDNNEPS